ncbi:MAG TPA: RecX family transcriptional regulator [Candidatus Saccharimonadales bacterium]|jgi:regulatory protein
MKITRIAKVGKQDKFAVFTDGTLKLFLSGKSILDYGLNVGDDISEEEVAKLTRLASEDELFLKSLKYLSARIRSEGEIRDYLKRHKASPDQQRSVMGRLRKLDLINDERFSAAFIHDKLMASPASKRKIAYELKKKHIAENIIEKSLDNESVSDEDSLKKLIAIKRRQTKYQDNLKLMQYLVRNGFNYGDVKKAINYEEDY